MSARTPQRKRASKPTAPPPAAVLALPGPSELLDAIEARFAAVINAAVDRMTERLAETLGGVKPRGLSAADAANYFGIGLTLFLSECEVEPRRIGGRKVWDRKRLDAWWDLTPGLGVPEEAAEPEPPSVADKLREARDAKKKNRRPRPGD